MTEPQAADNPFDKSDLEQFDKDDTEAGRFLGKMLSLFFFYTVVVMAVASWWTWNSIQSGM